MDDPSSSQSRQPRDVGAETDHQEVGPSGSLGESIVKWFRGLTRANGEADLKETLEEVIEEHGASDEVLDPEQREMLLNIVSFGELQVDDIMVPRADVNAVEARTPLPDLVAAFREARHSRIPVYRETLDDILGFMHIKDLIDNWDGAATLEARAMLRDVIFVPPSMPLLDLLARMRAARVHMAIVVDEYGGTDGLVTIEDVVEEIVGEIEDEHDEVEVPLIVQLDDGSYVADGRTEIATLEVMFDVDLLPDDADEDVDTLAGFVFSRLGRVPEIGERVSHECGLEFEVTDADARRIKRLKVRRASH